MKRFGMVGDGGLNRVSDAPASVEEHVSNGFVTPGHHVAQRGDAVSLIPLFQLMPQNLSTGCLTEVQHKGLLVILQGPSQISNVIKTSRCLPIGLA